MILALIVLLIAGVIITYIPMDARIKQIAYIIIGIGVLIVVLQAVLGVSILNH